MSEEFQDEHLMHEAAGVDPLPDHATELHGHMSRLAVLHEMPSAPEWDDISYDESNKFHDRASRRSVPGQFMVEAATHNGIPERVDYTADSAEKSKTLHAIHDAVVGEAHVTKAEEGTNWAGVSNKLLEKSHTAETTADKDTYLVGAVACTQFAPDKHVRTEFIRTVYDRGMQAEVAAACAASNIVLLVEGPVAPYQDPTKEYAATTIHSIKSYAPAFEMKLSQVESYLANIPEGGSTVGKDMPTPKSLQKEVARQSREGEYVEDTRTQAEHVSVGGEKVHGVLLDVNKIERFGLQQHFIKEQMDVVLAGPDLGHTALGDELARQRQPINVVSQGDASGRRGRHLVAEGPTDQIVGQLVTDAEESITELSAPVIAKFSLEGVDLQDMSSLTYDQAAALRFRVVIADMGKQKALAQYLDFEEFVESREREQITQVAVGRDEIWSTSEAGAAAPTVTGDSIKNIVNGALRSPDCADATPEELRDFAHQNRRKFLRMATHNIVDFVQNEFLSPEAIIERDEKGQLALKNELPNIPKDSADMYAAIALGCPALREQHPDRAMLSMIERAAYGSSNYIDHVMATIINEAYERGIFNLDNYRQQAQTPAA